MSILSYAATPLIAATEFNQLCARLLWLQLVSHIIGAAPFHWSLSMVSPNEEFYIFFATKLQAILFNTLPYSIFGMCLNFLAGSALINCIIKKNNMKLMHFMGRCRKQHT